MRSGPGIYGGRRQRPDRVIASRVSADLHSTLWPTYPELWRWRNLPRKFGDDRGGKSFSMRSEGRNSALLIGKYRHSAKARRALAIHPDQWMQATITGTALSHCEHTMQFKPRTAKGGLLKWSLIRWTYDASLNRSLPCTLGTLTATEIQVVRQPSDLPVFGRLTDDERAELVEFWKSARPPLMAVSHARSLRLAGATLERVAEAIDAGAATEPVARNLWEGLDLVGKALRQANFPRPAASSRRRAAAVSPAQPARRYAGNGSLVSSTAPRPLLAPQRTHPAAGPDGCR
jgi:hypothetical protein